METESAITLDEWCFGNTHARLLSHHGPTTINNKEEIHGANSTSSERNFESTDAISIQWIQPPHQLDHADIYQVPRTQEDVLEITPSPLSLPAGLYSTETSSPSSSTILFSTTDNITSSTTPTFHTVLTPLSPHNRSKRGRPRFDFTYPQYTNDPSRAARLAKGRLAARKHRERQGQKVEHLQELYTRYACRNEELKSEVSALREELLGLKSAVLRHAGCGFCPIEKYIAGKMLRFVDT